MGDDGSKLESLDFIINHVFFPPQLPQGSDISTAKNVALCKTFVELADEFGQHLDPDSREAWSHVVTMLQCYKKSQADEDFMVDNLSENFQRGLVFGGFRILYITKQNAGLFVHRMANGDVSVSSFEASFPNAQVMATEARIVCTFPGPGATVPYGVWANPSFSSQLNNFLFHMNKDEIDKAKAHTRKAKSEVTEERDVADPKYISELFMGILHGIGSPTATEDLRFVSKRIGDDVLWKDAYLPWRRSPVYLILRVGLQLALSYSDPSHHQFKAFMAFAHARLIRKVIREHPGYDTDLLYAIRVKLARRIQKLETRFSNKGGVPLYVASAAQDASKLVEKVLQERWKKVQQLQDQSPEWNPDSLSFEADTHLMLQKSRPRILRALQRSEQSSQSSSFTPNHLPLLRDQSDFRSLTPEKLQSAFNSDQRVALADFEYVIHTHLSSWTARNLEHEDASEVIYRCLETYLSDAQNIYSKQNPEDQSHMILALFALWVSLDKIVAAQIPLLVRYSPYVTIDLLEPLLLRQTNELDALRDIVDYISGRQNNADRGDGIFTDSDHHSTFYQRYFDSSNDLQQLKQQIEDRATKKRQECLQLLQQQNSHYHDLIKRADSVTHKHQTRRWPRLEEDTSMCHKCSLLEQAKNIHAIDVYEWPLPSELAAAKRVCFELSCPKPFEYWRAATWILLYDVGVSPQHRLESQQYGQLPGGYDLPKSSSSIRLTLASQTKSFKVSHYRSRPIPAKEQDILVNCGSTWRLFEISNQCWAGDMPFQHTSFKDFCTPSLSGMYKSLQFSLENTTHTSNAVIAAQSECHVKLSLHEFIAFGSLRSGGRLQWMNIAREVITGDLTFQSEAVHTLLLQAALQVGSWEMKGQLALSWHSILTNRSFCETLLSSFKNLMLAMSLNWDAAVTLRGIILLTCRLMSGDQTTEIQKLASELLRDARKIAYDWIGQIKAKLSSASEDHVMNLQIRLCDVATTCRATFSGDPAHVASLLQTRTDVSTFIYCAAIIYENVPPNRKGLSIDTCRFLDRDERLATSVYDHIANLVMNDWKGLDEAVELLWPSYSPSRAWQRLPMPNERWFETRTTASSDGVRMSQLVHINLIDGRLLINGRLVGRLPREIMNHELYARCLGKKIVDVIPSDMPGMEYVTRDEIFGSEIHFSSQDPDGLIIRTRQASDVSELIPHKYFQGDLPCPLVREYIHWLRISQQVVELSPFSSIWCTSSSNKCITNVIDDPQLEMKSGHLIDPNRQTAHMLSSQLQPLEYEDEMLIIFSVSDSIQVTVDLPRFHSAFQLKDQLLESKAMPGFCVDNHKSTGTMLGLQNQLVLRPVKESSTEPRRVLIPYGEVYIQRSGTHVTVKVCTDRSVQDANLNLKYHEYLIDTDLGYLRPGPSLTSRLYKVYLHALTSGRLADPLTGRTGTEEALLEYSSASCLTFLKLEAADKKLLKLIASLSPQRTFYPEHLQAMQTIAWHPDLPPLSQHAAFTPLTKCILGHAHRLALFSQHQGTKPTSILLELEQSSPMLSKRAEYREASFHSPDLQSISNISSQDSIYTLRSTMPNSSAAKQSQQVFFAFEEQLLGPHMEFPDIYSLFQEWNSIYPAAEFEDIDISYSILWLEPQLGKKWLSMFNTLRHQGREACYHALFTFTALGYHSPTYASIIPTFLAFGVDLYFKSLSLPPLSPDCSIYELSHGLEPKLGDLTRLATNEAFNIDAAPWDANLLDQYKDEHYWDFTRRRWKAYEDQKKQMSLHIAQNYMSQWPSSTAWALSDSKLASLFDMTSLHNSVQTVFSNCYQNGQLKDFLSEVQMALRNHPGCRNLPYPQLGEFFLPRAVAKHSDQYYQLCKRISLGGLLNSREPPLSAISSKYSELSGLTFSIHTRQSMIPDTEELENLLNEFVRRSSRPLLRRYGSLLNSSRLALHSEKPSIVGSVLSQELLDYYRMSNTCYIDLLEANINHLQPQTTAEKLLQEAGQWPRLTARILFQQLSIRLRESLSDDWRCALATLACGLIYFQRAQRLMEFQSLQSPQLSNEIEAIPVSPAEASQYLDWVLMQVESRFTLRSLQHTVLQEMIFPTVARNTTFQLNMGEGKSSVIAPLAAATLANKDKLVRLVVLKSLSRQMFDLLASRLTGLCGRRIFFLPFSRSVAMEAAEICTVQSLLEECRAGGGILVVQPEHLLSFRLLAIEKLVSGHAIGPDLLELQKWLLKYSRDILDESDEILHSKYQLIYTMGHQQPLEAHPYRWTIVQQVFSLVSCHLGQLTSEFPLDVDIAEYESGSFSCLRLLKPRPGEVLVKLLVDDIMAGRLESIHFGYLENNDRTVIRRFISQADVNKEDVDWARRRLQHTGKWHSVLLLRGLLGQGLLTYALQKRQWRVDYGLDPTRSLLAVPFRAKDVPSPSAEFGHPDIALLLTCLSYYYQGLDKDQLLAAFQILLNSDNAAAEYEEWIVGLNPPTELHHETGINLEDPTQFTEILIPQFHRVKRVIDFYLSAVVFPKAAKEFPRKLSTSAWDLAEKSERLKTGFSGTNDNRFLLPTSISQEDIAGQEGTSVRVLCYLQQPKNGPCITPADFELEHVHVEDLLKCMASYDTPIRVLFDVGAQILQINQDVAKEWLRIDSKAHAAIFFNNQDEITVLTHNGTIEPFSLSSFRDRLGECVVYLDDVHTRGTDLKFPQGARAMVTLGSKVTKDRLVQACMRLRQLGHGQNVTFFAPLEIARSIRECAEKGDSDAIQVIDILRWTMLKTCEDIEHHIPHWAQQGVDFHERDIVWTEAKESSVPDIDAFRSTWLRPEAKTLEQLYLPPVAQSSSALPISTNAAKVRNIPLMQSHLDMLGITSMGDASVDEEQEREVAQEIEQERQLERPPGAVPLTPQLQEEVRRLVQTGILETSSAFLPLFNVVPTIVRPPFSQYASLWSPQLWATRDFAQTIREYDLSKEHMRPVNWLLTSSSSKKVVALSPHEVQELLPTIQRSKEVNLHIYAPRVRRKMCTLDDLRFFCIPDLLPDWTSPHMLVIPQLNLFSGQLYFTEYNSYHNLCVFLGLKADFEGMEGVITDSDGFIQPADRRFDSKKVKMYYKNCPFVDSPITFLKELISLRRKGSNYSSTHLGKMMNGRILMKDDFQN